MALGTFAALVVEVIDPISRLRAASMITAVRLVPTFHPAYLLRNPACRQDVWEDMKGQALLRGEQ